MITKKKLLYYCFIRQGNSTYFLTILSMADQYNQLGFIHRSCRYRQRSCRHIERHRCDINRNNPRHECRVHRDHACYVSRGQSFAESAEFAKLLHLRRGENVSSVCQVRKFNYGDHQQSFFGLAADQKRSHASTRHYCFYGNHSISSIG